uniref:Protein LTV1 homolog n=1 Tax=Panagrellus redivivus TaxID=6233 RepID=A0A7E4UT69_PANRE
MGKKKVFIGRNEGVKFNLLHRSQKDPLVANHEASDRVLAPVQRNKNHGRHAEQLKYGIYLDDDYDYLQHLKDTNEIAGDIEDRTVIKVPEGAIQLPSTLFETKGVQLKVGLLNKAAPSAALPCGVDPDVLEVLEALDDDADVDGELDDDFMELAKGGGDFDDEDMEVEKFNPLMDEKSGKASMMARMGLIREQFSDEGSDFESGDDFDEEEEPKRPGNRNRITDLLTCGSISSSCMPRNEGKRIVDDHFEQIAEEYGDEHIGYGEGDEDDESDEEEAVDMNELSQAEWKAKLEELRGTAKIRFDELELPDDEIKRKTLLAASVDKPEKMEKVTLEPSGRKRNHWDAESILSTYSTAYNHPTLIKEPSKKKFGLTKKDLNALNSMEIDKVSMISATSVSTYRPKGETAEERRARKAAVKEAKRDRRVEKKANKLAFSEAERAMNHQAAKTMVKGRPIK